MEIKLVDRYNEIYRDMSGASEGTRLAAAIVLALETFSPVLKALEKPLQPSPAPEFPLDILAPGDGDKKHEKWEVHGIRHYEIPR